MVWLSTKAAAELLNYTERTIRKKASDKEYISNLLAVKAAKNWKSSWNLFQMRRRKPTETKMVKNAKLFLTRVTPAQRNRRNRDS